MKKALNLLLLIGVFELTIQPAYAYLDPGTGSVVVQTIIATFVAAGFALKAFWAQIIVFFKGKKKYNRGK